MTAEIDILQSKGLPADLADHAELFLKTGDPSIPRNTALPQSRPWLDENVGKALVSECAWNETTRALLRFFIHLPGVANGRSTGQSYLLGILRHLHQTEGKPDSIFVHEVISELQTHHPSLGPLVLKYLENSCYGCDWTLDPTGFSEAPFRSPISDLIFTEVVASGASGLARITGHPGLFAALALHQAELTRGWCQASPMLRRNCVQPWRVIVETSADYDDLCLECCTALCPDHAENAFSILHHLNRARHGAHLDLLLKVAAEPSAAVGGAALELLLKRREEEVIEIMTRAFSDIGSSGKISSFDGPAYGQLFQKVVAGWDTGGANLLRLVMRRVMRNVGNGKLAELLTRHLPTLDPAKNIVLRELFLEKVADLENRDLPDFWKLVTKSHARAFIADFEAMLAGKSKPLRELAARVLVEQKGNGFVEQAHVMLGAKKSDARLGAAAYFTQLADPVWLPVLKSALELEGSEPVKEALYHAMKACGHVASPSSGQTLADPSEVLASVIKQGAKLKLPPSSWLQPATLPELFMTDASVLPPEAIAFLLTRQSKQKEIAAAPDLVSLLSAIDRGKSATFAATLVERFLHSDQAASDRWALALGGLLGDNRIILLLVPHINEWCENSRHKLAEYAAQAISLLPGNEPLMVLDTLSNRYRSKFKNVGKACAEAFNAAATARGITTDELGDLVVPDFGFDAEGIRRFDWNGGGASAGLGADFKLTWFDPETDKAWKALPASAPEEIKTEVKTLTKLLREAVKGQTARLEMTLVRQRRWPVARWRELFENHPLLHSFASNLVWGVYDSTGKLLRTFRRYPNGLLADAAGALEELPESDTMIGMVHPLELDAEVSDAWRAHLTRFKVIAPFPQIDRPVELLDPLHGNRRSITLTDKKSVSAGTFRSRAEKRGWARGSVIDAGGISSYYKLYPGAGIEVILPTENFWVGCDPMEAIELGAAYFVKAESVERGSYIYNEPEPDDPRVMRFDAVPAVVWSETLSDLKAIVATKE